MTDDLLITDTDFTAVELAHQTKPPADPAKEIENKVVARPAEAKLIRVIDQATLDAVGDRLAINKALQKEADAIFDPVIATGLAAHRSAIAAKRKVLDPLTQEEGILKLAAQTYVVEQRRIAEEQERVARIAREAEERRLLAEAEARRKEEERLLNERLQREHEEEVERVAMAAEAEGSWPEDVAAILETPAPAHVSIPLDIPVLPEAFAAIPPLQLPKGMSVSRKFVAEVTSMALLCRAVAEGKVPSSYIEANMKALNARARADGAGFNVPGVRAKEDFTTGQRTR